MSFIDGLDPLISFITSFKKFKPPYDVIQHSAMYSWKANNIGVFTALNEAGIKEECSEYSNITFTPDVKRGRELGFNTQAPTVRDMIDKALPLIETPIIALINSDIIIEPGFTSKIKNILETHGFNLFLAGSRKGINLKHRITSPESYNKALNESRSHYDAGTSSDIFITSKYWWRRIVQAMPEFILGRYAWDNWLHLYAQENISNKFNCTKALPLIHCDHNYDHIIKQEGAGEKQAPSSTHNLRLWEPYAKKTVLINAWGYI